MKDDLTLKLCGLEALIAQGDKQGRGLFYFFYLHFAQRFIFMLHSWNDKVAQPFSLTVILAVKFESPDVRDTENVQRSPIHFGSSHESMIKIFRRRHFLSVLITLLSKAII